MKVFALPATGSMKVLWELKVSWEPSPAHGFPSSVHGPHIDGADALRARRLLSRPARNTLYMPAEDIREGSKVILFSANFVDFAENSIFVVI